MTDLERRLMRAATRLAVAAESLNRAEMDLIMLRDDLADLARRRARSVRWLAAEVHRELRRGDGTTDATGTTGPVTSG